MADALALDGLTARFGAFIAVDDVKMTVSDGELRVLLGANGAGKTTLMDMVSGRIPCVKGSVRVFGQDVTNWQEHKIANAGIGRKFQIPSVFRDLSVRQNIEVARCHGQSVFQNLRFGMSDSDKRRVSEIIEQIGLTGVQHRTAAHLSHGETQWLELGILVAQDPKVVLLDEPTAGMTADETQKTADIIKNLRGDHTLLVIEHDMSFVREIAEIITVLHLGKVIAEGSVSDIENNEEVRAAYLGSAGIS
ncbi:urea ABC transporter ATP-binding protein UrtD [Roseovarius atlanticus]|uniref:urea ABC transporter ATP-binding protein UrtD n=1 Tax=Roseovarius atlanticus TaxID=1641875 RepID=UPI001C96FC5E|nr:urea ABC transporter ATP-binding protein UrtD [Roseovarius atlanticus]MBY5987215.1 urea ABC transporter ATP-binding protein UrtD [Roseovarius atlanticus]MBY6125855.1 urea ABC transporter ATP-binding protein UrtD [Roseovarius atlanticus]MBY6149684.1 urea ABC transporter ATP-binding protein UrtD [Roseovarius atlanticus]